MMNKLPVFIDCDPGADDIIALLLGMNMPELDIVGISTLCGNVEASKTYVNALKTVGVAGKNIPVYKGAETPMTRELYTAKDVHGNDGMAGLSDTIAAPDVSEEKEKAWDAIYREAKKYNGELTLVAVGPMTNVAIALAKYKELASLLKQIVIMGGSAAYGNVTPAAEFNIYVDPEAADVLFKSGANIVMFGLDVTEQAILLPEEIEKIGQMTSPQAKFCYSILKNTEDFYLSKGFAGNCMHDPCTVMYLAYPELFSGKKAGICVETKARITRGKTVCDMFTDVKFGFENALVMMDVNRDGFGKKIIEIMSRY